MSLLHNQCVSLPVCKIADYVHGVRDGNPKGSSDTSNPVQDKHCKHSQAVLRTLAPLTSARCENLQLNGSLKSDIQVIRLTS